MERIKLTNRSTSAIYTTSVELDEIDTSKYLDIVSFVEDSHVFIIKSCSEDYIAYSTSKLESIGWSVVGNPVFIPKYALITYMKLANMEFLNNGDFV